MSESQEQQKESVAPKKARKSERREAAPGALIEPARFAEAAPIEIKVTSDEGAGSEPVAAPARPRSLPTYLAQAAALLVALGAGWAAGHATTAAGRPTASPVHEAILAVDWNGLAAGVQKAQGEAVRAAADVQTIKGSLAGLKDAVERSKQDAAGRFGQIADRLERIQKSEQESGAKLAGFPERIEKAEREMTARLGAIIERLDRMERQMTAQAPAAKPAVQAVAQTAAPAVAALDAGLRTGSVPDQSEGGKSEQPKTEQPKSEAKVTPIEGWVLREVYDGVALIEGRNKRLLEIAPGQSLAGVGRVESIERRGRSWVVVTTRGIITSQPW
jgi:hypothetical protein